jgi:hypothetical protein
MGAGWVGVLRWVAALFFYCQISSKIGIKLKKKGNSGGFRFHCVAKNIEG